MVQRPSSAPTTFSFQTTATPESIGWARAFTSSVATALGVDVEPTADLKLATSELVSETVVTHPGETLRIDGWIAGGRLVLRIAPWEGLDPEGRVLSAWDVASSLFDLEASSGSVLIYVDLDSSA